MVRFLEQVSAVFARCHEIQQCPFHVRMKTQHVLESQDSSRESQMAPREGSVSCIWPALCGVKLGFNFRKDAAVLGISFNILICSVKLKQPVLHEAVLDLFT